MKRFLAAAVLSAALVAATPTPVEARTYRIPWSKLNATQQRSVNTIRIVFPDHLEDKALRVAWCESRLIPTAKNKRSSATGLFQVLAKLHGPRARVMGLWPLTDGTKNAKFALDLHRRAGWRPWVCR